MNHIHHYFTRDEKSIPIQLHLNGGQPGLVIGDICLHATPDQLEELYGVIGQYLHKHKPARASRAVPAEVEPALDRRLRELAVPAEAATGDTELPPGWHRDGNVWRGPEGLCVAPAATIGQGWILTSHGEITIRPSERWHSTREGAIRMGAALLRDHCPGPAVDVDATLADMVAAFNLGEGL